MPFIGNSVQTQGFTPAIDYFTGNGLTTTFTLSRPVASVAQMVVVVDNVVQNPATAYTVSGNAITFTSPPLSSSNNNIWVEYTSLITTYAALSQSPSVIGDITASGGFLANGNFGNSYLDGTIVDYVTGNARITTGPADGLTIYNGGTSARNAMGTFDTVGNFTNNATGYTKIATGTTAQRPGTPSFGMMRANTTTGYIEYYDTISASWLGIGAFQASGGTITTYSSGGTNYQVHTFTTSGTFQVLAGAKTVDVLLIAGGGAGGTNAGGGGGAGGFVSQTAVTATVGAYSIVVGAGGANGGADTNPSGSGNNTTALTYTAIGGGGGINSNGKGGNGGSGGGSSVAQTGGSGTSGQGNKGGDGNGNDGAQRAAGGGGGAGAAGQNVQSDTMAGQGGNGLQSSINGTSTYYAGGGGGAAHQGGLIRSGGLGGGGNSGLSNYTSGGTAGQNGSANLGGGGGGGSGGGYVGGAGGSGIVIIRYIV